MNKAIIHIYFGKDRVALYNQDVVTYWYELLGKYFLSLSSFLTQKRVISGSFGGILGLFTGVSLLSVIELVYVFTVRFTIYLIETYKKSV